MSDPTNYPGEKHGKVSRRDDGSVVACAGPGPDRCAVCNAEREWQLQWFKRPAAEMEDLPDYGGEPATQANGTAPARPVETVPPAGLPVAGFAPGDLFTLDGKDAWEVAWVASVPTVCLRNLRAAGERQLRVGGEEIGQFRRLGAGQPQPDVSALLERLAKLEAALVSKGEPSSAGPAA